MVTCVRCGKIVASFESFNCKVCGREWCKACKRVIGTGTGICKDCTAKTIVSLSVIANQESRYEPYKAPLLIAGFLIGVLLVQAILNFGQSPRLDPDYGGVYETPHAVAPAEATQSSNTLIRFGGLVVQLITILFVPLIITILFVIFRRL